MLKAITAGKDLPNYEDEFMTKVQIYFPSLYDLKFMKHEYNELKGGLNRLAELLDVTRTGPKHQAGSDSLVTLGTYFKFKEQFGNIDKLREAHGVLFGLGKSFNDETYMDFYMQITN